MAFFRICRKRIFLFTALVVAATYLALETFNPKAARDVDAAVHARKSQRKSPLTPLVTMQKKSSLTPLASKFFPGGNEKLDLVSTDVNSNLETLTFNKKSSLVPVVQKFSHGDKPKLDVTVSDLKSRTSQTLVQNREATNNPIPRNISFLINNPTLCSDEPNLKYIIYIHTSPGNVARRERIRSTWANKGLFIDRRTKLVFLCGQAQIKDDMDTLMHEISTYEDIIVGDFVDHYQNLTLKAIMGLKWVKMFCQNADYAIKADDDAFVNIFEVMKIVESHQESKRLVVCPLWNNGSMPILRDPKECRKWCVKNTEFPGQDYFPQYCAGLSFLLSRELVSQMYDKVRTTPFFWIDDVYVTGLLLGKLNNVQYVDLLKNFTVKQMIAFRQYANLSQPITYHYVHAKRPQKFLFLWEALLQRTPIDNLKIVNEAVFANFPKVMARLLDLSTSVKGAM